MIPFTRLSPERYNTCQCAGQFRVLTVAKFARIGITCRKTPTDSSKLYMTHAMHERCLTLFDHIFGTPRTTDRLRHSLGPVINNWQKILCSLEQECINESWLWSSFVDKYHDNFCHQPELWQEYETKLGSQDGSDQYPGWYPNWDPINISELRHVIFQAKRKGAQRASKDWVLGSFSIWQHKTPYDIQPLILDHLKGISGLSNALTVFRWCHGVDHIDGS